MFNFAKPAKPTTGQGIGATAKQSTAGAEGDEEDGAQAELRKARFFAPAKNDLRKMTESECVAELFKMYEKLCKTTEY